MAAEHIENGSHISFQGRNRLIESFINSVEDMELILNSPRRKAPLKSMIMSYHSIDCLPRITGHVLLILWSRQEEKTGVSISNVIKRALLMSIIDFVIESVSKVFFP